MARRSRRERPRAPVRAPDPPPASASVAPSRAVPPTLRAFEDGRADAVAFVVTLVAAVAFFAPVTLASDRFGVNDWDLLLFHTEAARRSIAVHHAWPAWNPWYCGGSPLLANPQSVFLHPLFGLDLLLGTHAGSRWSLPVAAVLGFWGATLLARRVGASRPASWSAGVVYAFSSVYTLHIATGHLNWLAMAYLPWALWGAWRAFDGAEDGAWPGFVLGAGVGVPALSFLLGSGNAYFFVYACLAVALLTVVRAWGAGDTRIALRVLLAGLAFGVLVLGLSAVKLLPMGAFLPRVSRYDAHDASGATWELLGLALTGRDQSMLAVQSPGMQWRWWEYGAYVGLVPLGLSALGAWAASVRRSLPWLVVAAFFLWFARGSEGFLWPLLRALPAFEGLRVPARAIVVVVLVVSVFAARGLDEGASRLPSLFPELSRAVGWLPVGMTALLLLNAFDVTRAPLDQAFTLPRPVEPPADDTAAFHQTPGRRAFVTFTRYTDHLDHALRNEGALLCHERLHLPIRANAATLRSGAPDPSYRGEVFVEEGAGEVRTVAWSPDAITLEASLPSGGRVVVNQNHDPGWSTREPGVSVEDAEGRIGVRVPASAAVRRITLRYTAEGGAAGAWMSALTVVLMLAAGLFSLRRAARTGADPRSAGALPTAV